MTHVETEEALTLAEQTSTDDERPIRGATRPSAVSILLKRSWIVILGAVVVAAVVYGISNAVSATYASSADVAVTVSGTDVNATSLGANNLASQYAQMVNASQVLTVADKRVGNDIPSSSISGGAIGAQNLIQVQATGGTALVAQQRAAAVANAFIGFVSRQVLAQANSYERTSRLQLKPLDAQIASTQAQINALNRTTTTDDTTDTTTDTTTTSSAQALESTLQSLIAQRAQAFTVIAQTSVAGRPTLTLVSVAGSGSQTAPKPKLYALVGFLIALFLIARLVTYFGVDKQDAGSR
jgi:hypothetical protein